MDPRPLGGSIEVRISVNGNGKQWQRRQSGGTKVGAGAPRKRGESSSSSVYRGGSPAGSAPGVAQVHGYLYADVSHLAFRALVSTSVPFVCTSDDVSYEAPPKVVVDVSGYPLPTSASAGVAERKGRGWVVVATSVVVAVRNAVVVVVVVVERTVVEARFWKRACAKPPDRLFVSVIAS